MVALHACESLVLQRMNTQANSRCLPSPQLWDTLRKPIDRKHFEQQGPTPRTWHQIHSCTPCPNTL
jgi:hypothetical protein